MTIAYYISAHGFGHAARSVQVLQEVPESIQLYVKSSAPEWFFWQEVHRPFTYVHDNFDCGTLENERHAIDRDLTLKVYATITERNAARFEEEALWLQSIGARLVVTDVPSFPLRVAHELGIPSAVVANFTWVDIYRPYLKRLPQFTEMVRRMEQEYALADVMYSAPPALPMSYFPQQKPISLLARKGTSRREELIRSYGLRPDRPIVLCYPGNLGSPFRWRALDQLPEFTFLTFASFQGARPKNIVTLDQGVISHPDIVASVDAVVAKAGYGMVGECMANGVPMLYTTRDHFAEFQVLDQALQDWGASVRITQKEFSTGHWREGLAALLSMERPEPVRSDGAQQVVQGLIELLNKTTKEPADALRRETAGGN